MSERDKIVAHIERKLESGNFAMSGEAELHALVQEIEAGQHLVKPKPTIPFADWRDKPSCGR